MASGQNNQNPNFTTLWYMLKYGAIGAASGLVAAALIEEQLKAPPECSQYTYLGGSVVIPGNDPYCAEKLSEMTPQELNRLGVANYLGTRESLTPFWHGVVLTAGIFTGAAVGAYTGYQKAQREQKAEAGEAKTY